VSVTAYMQKTGPPRRIESPRFGTFDWTKLNICPIFVLTIALR